MLQHTNYLELMGITTWQLRSAPSLTEPCCYLLSNAKNQALAYLIATLNSVEEEDLLTNIVKALEAQLSLIEKMELDSKQLPYLIFGSQAEKFLSATENKQKIMLCALEDMLRDPSLKKQVWQKLQPFRSKQ